MKRNSLSVRLAAGLLALLPPALFAQGTAFTYQGRLLAGNSPANGSYDIQFTLYQASLLGNPVAGPVTNLAVAVSNGLFTTTVDLGNAFTGADSWLEIAVSTNSANTFTSLTPRQQLTPAPGSLFARTAGNLSGTLPTTQLSGVIPNQLLPGFQGNFNTVGGGQNNAATGSFSTIAGGINNQAASYGVFIGGGWGNTATNNYSTIGGGYQNQALGQLITIGGGQQNIATNNFATIAGGANNLANGNATVGGGFNNTASGYSSTVSGGGFNTAAGSASEVAGGSLNNVVGDYSSAGGGYANTVPGYYAVLGGGRNNLADSYYSAVGGGQLNNASAYGAVIAGGSQNTNAGNYATVSGGQNNFTPAANATIGGGANNLAWFNATVAGGGVNSAMGTSSSIAGGWANAAEQEGSFIGGGLNNTNSALAGVIGGGSGNRIFGAETVLGGGYLNYAHGTSGVLVGGANNVGGGDYSFLGGGHLNGAVGSESVVVGGEQNYANAMWSAIGGGLGNSANGWYAVVPGGATNQALGQASFAAGAGAFAQHDHAFVWSDAYEAYFGSTQTNQFNVRAAGGIRLVTAGAGATLDGQNILAGNLTAGRLSVTNPVGFNSPANQFQGSFSGNGASLTNLSATQITGTLPLSAVPLLTSNQLDAATWQAATNRNGGFAAVASNVVAGISITNPLLLNTTASGTFTGNGTGLTNVSAQTLNGLSAASFAAATNPAVTGTLTGSNAQLSGMIRLGSESGAVAPNYPDPSGMLVRRVGSTSSTNLLARTDTLTLERDGSNGGLLIRWTANPGNCAVSAIGVTSAGTLLAFHNTIANPSTTGTLTVFSASQNVVHYEVSFGNSYLARHITHAVLERYDGDNYIVGTVTSSYNQ